MALGLEAAQGLVLTESYYWDLTTNPRVRQALLRTHRSDAQHDPGIHLFGHPALPEGDQRRRHEGRDAVAKN